MDLDKSFIPKLFSIVFVDRFSNIISIACASQDPQTSYVNNNSLLNEKSYHWAHPSICYCCHVVAIEFSIQIGIFSNIHQTNISIVNIYIYDNMNTQYSMYNKHAQYLGSPLLQSSE